MGNSHSSVSGPSSLLLAGLTSPNGPTDSVEHERRHIIVSLPSVDDIDEDGGLEIHVSRRKAISRVAADNSHWQNVSTLNSTAQVRQMTCKHACACLLLTWGWLQPTTRRPQPRGSAYQHHWACSKAEHLLHGLVQQTRCSKHGAWHSQESMCCMQGLLTLAISCLTVGKLIEEIRFIRSLRGELGSIAAAFAGEADGGVGGANYGGSGVRADAANSQGTWSAASDLAAGLAALGAGPSSGSADKASGSSGGTSGWATVSGLDDVKMVLQEATVLPTLRPDLFKVCLTMYLHIRGTVS